LSGEPSPFFVAWQERVRASAGGGLVLDLACGGGRHTLAAAALGVRSAGIDRDAAKLRALADEARTRGLPASALRADLEAGRGIPVRAGASRVILVFRFLFRPLAAAIGEALAPGGLLLYETFTQAQRDLGYGPRNPAFLLAPNELPGLFPGLEVLAYEELLTPGDRPEALARLAARRPA